MAHDFLKRVLQDEQMKNSPEKILFAAGLLFLLNSFIVEIIDGDPVNAAILSMISALLTGTPLIIHAARDLMYRRLEMNELAALSFLASFCVGEYRAASFIASFMIFSTLLEHRSQMGARKSIEALMRLAPAKARRLSADNTTHMIEAALLQPNDLVQVRAGERIPGDGVILEGSSAINEAPITGESAPVAKTADDRVYSGTMNLSGVLTIRIMAEGYDSTLTKIKKLIVQAEKSRTPVMRLIDQNISWYTPFILTVAGIIFFFTRDVHRSISMLILACPCTILLSSPTAFVAALSAAARLGVIVKDLAALERADTVDCLIFDKTGTLTTGQLLVDSVHPLNGFSAEDVLRTCAQIERYSNHPVARAVLERVPTTSVTAAGIRDIEEIAGHGIKGTVGGQQVCAGKREWVSSVTGLQVGRNANDSLSPEIVVVRNRSLLGSITFRESLKPDAVGTVRQLQGTSKRRSVMMLTGDRLEAARQVAEKLECDVKAEILPHEKLEIVNETRSRPCTVAVIGDGINDAPALAAGDVSIAMGAAGSDVAIHSASIVLMNDKLNRIPFIFSLSRRVTATIRQNLLFSLTFIAVMVSFSAAGKITPVAAVLLHTASTMAIIFNSARILRTGEDIV